MSMNSFRKRCIECGQYFETPYPHKISCSTACATKRRNKQLEAIGVRRKKLAKERLVEKPCAVCSRLFGPYSSRCLYCSPDCRKVGLSRAVERQRLRRAISKSVVN